MIDNKIVTTIDDMLTVQLDNVSGDDYMKGMYNGMEFVRSIVTGAEPVYIDSEGELDAQAKERNPERYI